ncbi:MAG TPA: class I SAM-dependent methyltransferase [Polyangiaceae bacterium]|nr:class I SAM-dependent methyltransferase [Polyangiaceae bacterium]
MAELHDLNPTGRFSDRTDDYVKYRPSYPKGAIDAIVAGLEGAPSRAAVDIGAGTGISARLLADRGLSVVAVEPNQQMREAADGHAGVAVRQGTAEATGLETASMDLVLAAQAFHWFRPDEALREFARILRPRGRLALMWSRRRRDDPFTAGYRTAILEVGGDSLVERMDFHPEIVAASGHFSAARLVTFPLQQVLDFTGLVGRAMSASYVPRTGPEAAKVHELLRALHARYADGNGFVTLKYTTEVYIAEAQA